jgi:hypothetical protein
VHRGQYYEAFFVGFHKAIHRIILILIISDFLANTLEVQANGGITDDHFEAEFANFQGEILNLLSH